MTLFVNVYIFLCLPYALRIRLVSRYIIKQYVIDALPKDQYYGRFKSQLTLIKRVLFSRSLRLLPLPEQVGAVEALAVIVDQLPELIPLDDQHLLAFLSELLKMSSVADGEMTDPNLVGSVVDKNGYAVPAHDSSNSANKETKTKHHENPSSAIFLRRDCILSLNQSRIYIPRELPSGVQLRVSSINLLRAVIRGHPNPFFDAESSTPIGTFEYFIGMFTFAFVLLCSNFILCSKVIFVHMSLAFCFDLLFLFL